MSRFEIGDAVWHPVHGYGEVYESCDCDNTAAMHYLVLFKETTALFYVDGNGLHGGAPIIHARERWDKEVWAAIGAMVSFGLGVGYGWMTWA